MQSYEAHRFFEARLADLGASRIARLCVIDSGLGGGGTAVANLDPEQIKGIKYWTKNGAKQGQLIDVEDRVGISDPNKPRGHGTGVAVFGVGTGTSTPENAVLGMAPGGHLVFYADKLTGDLEIDRVVLLVREAAKDPAISIINLSYDAWSGALNEAVKSAVSGGKIVVAAAGNSGQDLFDGLDTDPASIAPEGPRAAAGAGSDVGLIVAVGGTSLVSTSGTLENSWRSVETASNYSKDGKISIVAPAELLPALRPEDQTIEPRSGTSFASPMVAGLLLNMLDLDRATAAGAAGLAPIQLIEIMEATADPIGGPTVTVGTTGGGIVIPNNQAFGHGRLNAWKALLSVANRGVANPKGPHFSQLAALVKTELQTGWYGVVIRDRSLRQNARLAIDIDGIGPQQPKLIVDGLDSNNDGTADSLFNSNYPLPVRF
jgi:hypothetical protein